jgi:hypothetical protein
MKAIRLRVVSTRIARVGDDGDTCGATCQYLAGNMCRIDGAEELGVDSAGVQLRSDYCREAEVA